MSKETVSRIVVDPFGDTHEVTDTYYVMGDRDTYERGSKWWLSWEYNDFTARLPFEIEPAFAY